MRVLPLTLALAGALTTIPALAAPSDAGAPVRHIVSTRWATTGDLEQGRSSGLTVHHGTLSFAAPAGTRGGYDYGTWKSPWVSPGFDLTELVPSWNASTPGDSWLKIAVRGRNGSHKSSWDTIGTWAHDDKYVRRSSPDAQTDDLGRVSYDTWLTSGVSSWRLRVTLYRRTGQSAGPVVENVGAMVSRLPSVSSVATSKPGRAPEALGTVLPVPRYSQMVHQGEYPQYDGGGEAWCSPTSTTMVLGYYDALPSRHAYRWVNPSYPDRVVPHIARMVYDTRLGGTGNWPFNTAYAASRTGRAFVTRLRDLREAERFIAAGIPLIASISFSSGQLSGAPISSTNGHLLVIVGFTKSGDVVVNDPAASSRAGVRRTYDRGQFEDAWLKRYSSGSSMRGSGGMVYVIHDDDHPLPARDGNRNW